jgi:hypothetical protein
MTKSEANNDVDCVTGRHFASAQLCFRSHSDMRHLPKNPIIQRNLSADLHPRRPFISHGENIPGALQKSSNTAQKVLK